LSNKYSRLYLDGGIRVVKKRKSLSIGEIIATAFANLLRHIRTEPIQQLSTLHSHWGYVDDTLSLVLGTKRAADLFVSTLEASMAPLRWKHSISTTEADFLDLHIETSLDQKQLLT